MGECGAGNRNGRVLVLGSISFRLHSMSFVVSGVLRLNQKYTLHNTCSCISFSERNAKFSCKMIFERFDTNTDFTYRSLTLHFIFSVINQRHLIPSIKPLIPNVPRVYQGPQRFNSYASPKNIGIQQFANPLLLNTPLVSPSLHKYPVLAQNGYKKTFRPMPYSYPVSAYPAVHPAGYHKSGATLLPVPVAAHPAYLGYGGYPGHINGKGLAKTLLYSLLFSQVLRLSG